MKRLLVTLSLVLITISVAAGCASQAQSTDAVPVTGWEVGGTGAAVSTPSVQDYNQLARAAGTYGLDVQQTGPIKQPFFEQEGVVMRINGQDIQVFQFADEAQQAQALGQIRNPGEEDSGTPVVLVESLQVWAGGKMIVLYAGRDQKVLDFLNAIFGQPKP